MRGFPRGRSVAVSISLSWFYSVFSLFRRGEGIFPKVSMTALRTKRALVTGAGHGLGLAIARRLAAAGAEVVVTDLDPNRVTAAVGELGPPAVGYTLDVTDGDQVRAVRERVNAERGPIDVLVNNAGVVFGGEFLK